MREVDAGEDEPTVIIKHWVSRDITTPPIVERQVGPAVFEDGSLSGSDLATPAPRSGVGWQVAASVVVAALLAAAVFVLR